MILSELICRSEGKTLEFKRDLSSSVGLVRTAVAFANSAGGTILIGVEDRTRRIVGVGDPFLMEERLANVISDAISPRLLAEIEILPWQKTHIVAVVVHPSSVRPHYVSATGPDGGTYVRLGSTNRQADSALIAELRRSVLRSGFDEEPISELDSEAIDFAAASQSFVGVRSLTNRDMMTIGLLRDLSGRSVPTMGGMILFGRDRLRYVPDAWIQVGRFAGSDRSDILDSADLREYPILAIEAAIRFVERNTRAGVTIDRLRHKPAPTVPPLALREALINAVVHSDYSQSGGPTRIAIFNDRIEIENPGILLPGLTIQDLREGVSRVRNRTIARVFRELGLVEQWGSGIQRMESACKEAGLPPPGFQELALRFRVTLRTVPVTSPSVDPIEDRILEFISSPDGRSSAEIARHIGLTPRAAQLRLTRLAERGLAIAIGSGPQDPRRRWFRAI